MIKLGSEYFYFFWQRTSSNLLWQVIRLQVSWSTHKSSALALDLELVLRHLRTFADRVCQHIFRSLHQIFLSHSRLFVSAFGFRNCTLDLTGHDKYVLTCIQVSWNSFKQIVNREMQISGYHYQCIQA